MPFPVGVLVHDQAVLAAEGARQAAIGVSSAQNKDGRPGVVGISLPPPSPATTVAANIAYARACLASAIANGLSPTPYLNMLRENGAGGMY